MRYVCAQLSFPGFAGASLLLWTIAMRLPLPGCMEHDAAHDADQDQTNAAQYQVCACPEADQTRSEGFVAGCCQELQGAVCQALDIEGRQLLCVFARWRSICLRRSSIRGSTGDNVAQCYVGVGVGGRVWRIRRRCYGVAHGGCASACIKVQQQLKTCLQRAKRSGNV